MCGCVGEGGGVASYGVALTHSTSLSTEAAEFMETPWRHTGKGAGQGGGGGVWGS